MSIHRQHLKCSRGGGERREGGGRGEGGGGRREGWRGGADTVIVSLNAYWGGGAPLTYQ